MPDEVIEVYEDCWDTFCVFDSMATQWRFGGDWRSGLDYNVIPFIQKSLGINEAEEILPGIRIMESEALLVLAEERERNAKKK